MSDLNYSEARLRRLEAQISAILRALRNALEMARRALEMSQRGGPGFGGGGSEVRRAVVTEAFLAGSTSAATPGKVTLHSRNPATGAYTNLATDVPCWNGYPKAIPVGGLVYVAYVDGALEILTYACP